MNRNSILFALSLMLAVVAIAACTPVDNTRTDPGLDVGANTTPQLVGNDTDEYGCKASAGYTWCAEKSRCIRTWEEPCGNVTNSTTAQPPGKKLAIDCPANPSVVCTKEYVPVCGQTVLNTGQVVFQTFGNKCEACAAMKVVSYTQGACENEDNKSDDSVPPPPSGMPARNGTGPGPRLAFTECTDPRPQMCTMDYNPVCGEVDTGIRCIKEPCPSTTQKTYSNGCGACADPNVRGYWPGACEDQPQY